MTKEECRDEFLRHVSFMLNYWLREERATTAAEKMEGFAFSILVAIDGASMALPGFKLMPDSHPDDEGPWPEVDIAGSLHDNWHRVHRATVKRETP